MELVPSFFIQMVDAIYSSGRLFETDGGKQSPCHTQVFDISQGCPLSHFLFVILMTVLLGWQPKEAACTINSCDDSKASWYVQKTR